MINKELNFSGKIIISKDKSNRKLYKHQKEAIAALNKTITEDIYKALLVIPTGGGKTFTSVYWVMNQMINNNKKVLWIAHRHELLNQTIDTVWRKASYKNIVDNRESFTYRIISGMHDKPVNIKAEDDFIVASKDSLNRGSEYLEKWIKANRNNICIVVDEAHHAIAKTYRNIINLVEKHSTEWIRVLGLTATPKETRDTSNIDYFGKPVYTYSLKQGIEDGFLAPYKVIRIGLDKDLEGYRPTKGKLDAYGQVIEDREYNVKDFDKNIIIDDRTKKVAQKVTEFLKKTDRFSKTIIFCVDIDHAERMRQALVNENSDLVSENPKYIMRITGDNQEGKAQLDNFIDEERLYPTIVTTSKLMTTGVDCKTCKLIVLDNIFGDNGMTEFKQIIGRGTRLKPEYGKEYFTIIDFRNASRLFSDSDWDGEPTQVYEPNEEDGYDIVPPEERVSPEGETASKRDNDDIWDDEVYEKPAKYVVRDVEVTVISERVQYYDKDGKLITESIKDYSKKNILDEFATLDIFLNRWNSEEKKEAIIEELKEHGVLLDALREDIGNYDIDDFDLICHIAFDKKPLTKRERANNVKKRGYLYKYSDMAQNVLERLLERYMNEGIKNLEKTEILELDDFKEFGSPLKIVKLFGNKKKYIEAVRELEKEIYA